MLVSTESNIARLVDAVKERGPKKVLVQLPEGIVMQSQKILEALETAGIKAMISLDPMFGGCDLRDSEARRLGCDLLVNVGHSDFGVKEEVPTLYFHWYIDVDVAAPLKKNLDGLKQYKRIGILTSINFLHKVDDVKAVLEEAGHEVVVGKGSIEAAQILGCNVSAGLIIQDKVDAFLFFGSGHFHPLGLGLRSDVPLYVLDLEKSTLARPDYRRFELQQQAAMIKAKESEKIGILVSTKPGQGFVDPFKMKDTLERKGKKAWIFTMDLILPERLEFLNVDLFVNTACPRIPIENRLSFKKPILNPDELARALG